MSGMKCFSGDGIYRVEAEVAFCGKDLSVRICGGTLHHIGASALAVYEAERDSATVSTMTVYTHRDDRVAAYFAKEISREMKCTVSACAGIHVDDAREDEIILLWENSKLCCETLVQKLKAMEEA